MNAEQSEFGDVYSVFSSVFAELKGGDIYKVLEKDDKKYVAIGDEEYPLNLNVYKPKRFLDKIFDYIIPTLEFDNNGLNITKKKLKKIDHLLKSGKTEEAKHTAKKYVMEAINKNYFSHIVKKVKESRSLPVHPLDYRDFI
jgi:hypothetical protein